MILFLDMPYTTYTDTAIRTCHASFLIENKIRKATNKWKCARQCDENLDCMFFFFREDNCCALYSSCSRLGTTDTTGITFEIGI